MSLGRSLLPRPFLRAVHPVRRGVGSRPAPDIPPTECIMGARERVAEDNGEITRTLDSSRWGHWPLDGTGEVA